MILVFKPSGVHQVYKKFFSFFGDFARFKQASTSQFVLNEKEMELPLDSLNEKQLEKWMTGVQWMALFNRACLFISKKIKIYQESRFNIISFVFGILFLIINTTLSFALLNFGLYKIDPGYFEFFNKPSFFTFFYYSFNNFLFNAIQELTPKAPIAKIVSMTESMFALFLIAIFISLVLSFRSEREANELNKVITFLSEEGDKAEKFLKEKYRLNSIGETMQALEKLNAFLANWLYRISDSLNN